MKYNDICITESSWEELERDSFGGMTNASAYCLMYIDDRLPHLITGPSSLLILASVSLNIEVTQLETHTLSPPVCHPDDTDDETGQVLRGMDSLPPVLRRYVHEDNRWFQQELNEWEEQFCQTAAPQGEATTAREAPNPDPDDTQQAVVEPAPQSGPSNDQPKQDRAEPGAEPGAEKESKDEPREEHQGVCGGNNLSLLTHIYLYPTFIWPTLVRIPSYGLLVLLPTRYLKPK